MSDCAWHFSNDSTELIDTVNLLSGNSACVMVLFKEVLLILKSVRKINLLATLNIGGRILPMILRGSPGNAYCNNPVLVYEPLSTT